MVDRKQKIFIEEDLFYELRMLLGASKTTQLFDEKSMGNPTNFFKDSVYLHIRNLYNFFWGNANNDASVYDYIIHVFDVSLYIKWKKALHKHVLHIKNTRAKADNEVHGEHLNTMTQNFTSDIVNPWKEWIEVTTDKSIKALLEQTLEIAQKEAQDDYDSLKEKILEQKK